MLWLAIGGVGLSHIPLGFRIQYWQGLTSRGAATESGTSTSVKAVSTWGLRRTSEFQKSDSSGWLRHLHSSSVYHLRTRPRHRLDRHPAHEPDSKQADSNACGIDCRQIQRRELPAQQGTGCCREEHNPQSDSVCEPMTKDGTQVKSTQRPRCEKGIDRHSHGGVHSWKSSFMDGSSSESEFRNAGKGKRYLSADYRRLPAEPQRP